MDTVSKENICRQEHMADQVRMAKVEAAAVEAVRINPQVRVETHQPRFLFVLGLEIAECFGDTDLFIFCVDNPPANARGNTQPLQLGKPAICWVISARKGRRDRILDAEPCVLLPLHLCRVPLRCLGKRAGGYGNQ